MRRRIGVFTGRTSLIVGFSYAGSFVIATGHTLFAHALCLVLAFSIAHQFLTLYDDNDFRFNGALTQ